MPELGCPPRRAHLLEPGRGRGGCGGGGGARGTHRRRLELYQDWLERPIDEAWREGPRAPAHVAVCQGPGRRGRGRKRVRAAAARPGSRWRAMGVLGSKRPFGPERRATSINRSLPGRPRTRALGRAGLRPLSRLAELLAVLPPAGCPAARIESICAVTARVGLFSTSPWLACPAAAAPAAVRCSSWLGRCQHSSTRIGMAHPRDVEGEQRRRRAGRGRQRHRRAASAAPPRVPASSNH